MIFDFQVNCKTLSYIHRGEDKTLERKFQNLENVSSFLVASL